MEIWAINRAINEAKETLRKADERVGIMAGLCAGRLRKSAVSCDTFEQLKRELRDYNIHTVMWKNES